MKTFTGFLKSAIVISLCLITQVGYPQRWEWAGEIYFPYFYGYYDAWSPVPEDVAYDNNGNTYVTGYVTLVIEDQVNINKKFLFLSKFDGQGNLVWKKIFGGYHDASSSGGTDLVVDLSGNIYVTGYFEATLQLGPFQLQSAGEADIFLAKFTIQGLLTWWNKAGGSGADYGNGITLDNQGNIFLTGQVEGAVYFGAIASNVPSSDFFIAKYDPNGTPQWVKRAGTANGWSKGSKIHNDNAGNVSVLGKFNEDVTLENTTLTAASSWNEYFVAKFTDSGNLLWTEQLWGSQPLETVDISTDLSGNTVVTGTFYTNVVIGNNTLNAFNGYDAAFLAKFSPTGNLLWARQTGAPNIFTHYGSRSISTDAEGSSYITGYRLLQGASSADLLVRKYNAGGWVVWTKINQFAYQSGDAISRVISTDDNGNSYVTGYLFGNPVYLDNLVLSNSQYPSRAFIAKLPDAHSTAPFLKFNEAIVCFPCFPYDPVLDYEYRFWSERVGMKEATYRKVSGSDNRDEILWKGDRLEIKLHDELSAGTHYCQLRAIAKDGAVSDWTETLAFEIKDKKAAMLVYPNPVKDRLFIDYQAIGREAILLSLHDRYGKLLLKEGKEVEEGKNTMELTLPGVKPSANPLTLQLQSQLQGVSAWQLMRE